jgi:hypothetical protein
MKLLLGFLACVAALSITAQAATVRHLSRNPSRNPPPARRPSMVTDVRSVKLDLSIRGTSVTITAVGTTHRGIWSRPQLVERTTRPPADGIYSFSFMATRPARDIDQRSRTIVAKRSWQIPPGRFVGVRVVANRNSVTQRLPKAITRPSHRR